MEMQSVQSHAQITSTFALDETMEVEAPRRASRGVFDAAGISQVGRVRTRNEDAYTVSPRLGYCAVADGLGGRPGGHLASTMAILESLSFLSDACPQGRLEERVKAPERTQGILRDLLMGAVLVANNTIVAAAGADPRYKDMGTTYVGLLASGRHAAIAHVGDSRAYRIRRGNIERLTQDHSMRELYLRTFGDRARPEVLARNASIVTRALGIRGRVKPDVTTCEIEPGDAFLLCSDGLWDLVGDDEMASAVGGSITLESALAKMMALAYNRGAHDNVTAVLARI